MRFQTSSLLKVTFLLYVFPILLLIIGAFIAIRRGDRELHPKLMKAAIGLGAV